MNLQQWIDNPLGKGSILNDKENTRRLNELYKDISKTIKVKLFKGKDKNKLYFYIKIPSESFPNDIFYDVVIELYRPKDSQNQSIYDMNFRFFSNCPSFVYYYAYAYNKRGFVMTSLQKRITEKSIVDPPNIRNPYRITAHEFSIYLAVKTIVSGPKNFDSLMNIAETKKLGNVIKDIQNFNGLMKRYKSLKKAKSAKNKINRSKIQNQQDNGTKQLKEVNNKSKKNKMVKRTKKAKKVKKL